MSAKKVTNIAASVRAKLYRMSKDRQEDFNLLLVRYGSERLLYRLGISEYRDRFVLKGAFLLQALWSESVPYRPTRDIDLLGYGGLDEVSIRHFFESLCGMTMYPIESVVAEKLEAIISIGMLTSRMKDFYDLFMILETFTLDTPTVSAAIVATFKRRKTPLPEETPDVLTEKASNDEMKGKQWNAFLRRIGMEQKNCRSIR